MELEALGLERWQPTTARAGSAGLASLKGIVADAVAPVAAPTLAARLKFLTAEGQSATRLEQEALLGSNDLVEASFLDRLALVTRCVGRLKFATARGRSYATGFLIAPGLAITNHHVFPDAERARGASIEFDYRYDLAGQVGHTVEYDLDPGTFFVANAELDYAVVAVSEASVGGPLKERGYLRLHAETGKAMAGDFVTIVQHPDGLPMRIALRENEIVRLEPDEPVLWYRADTAHGSSGAPVFNDSFQLVALHSSGRIERNERGEYRLIGGGWAASLEGLGESDVVWEANVGIRVSRICADLIPRALERSPSHAAVLEEALRGGDILSEAVERAKGRTLSEPRRRTVVQQAEVLDATQGSNVMNSGASGSGLLIPLQLRISVEAAGASASPVPASRAEADGRAAGLESEALEMRVPIIYDGLDRRGGFKAEIDGNPVPVPELTEAGLDVAAPLTNGSGFELRYHKFSVWMHKERRLALFTASNVDWTARRKLVDGKPVDRDSLAGFPKGAKIAEQWVTDPRIAPGHQLPDVFYTDDRKAFDKGHLVRRDDVCWGDSFEDIQMANGDTYHVTNCSPQIKAYNQAPHGDENWGDLEKHVQDATKAEKEKVAIFAGPIFRADDRWFRGKDDSGPVRIQIPSRYWKIVVALGESGPEAYGFIIEQDVTAITEKEFFVPEEWKAKLKKLSDIQSLLRGWVSLEALVPHDRYDEVHANGE